MHTIKNMIRAAALATVIVTVTHARAAEIAGLDIQLALETAVFQGDGPVAGGPVLFLDISRTDGRWERVWGNAPQFNKNLAEGLVTAGSASDDTIQLSISVFIPSDAWVKGGRGRYEVELKRTETGDFAGTYTGTFRDVPVKGWARAVGSARRIQGQPVVPGEHPRLMFRKADLPALREKAKTPFGQAAMAKLDGVIGKALKHQLTGDKQLAMDIIPEVEKLLADVGVGDKMVRGRILGWRFEQVALAYDLCYDAWPDEFKRKVENYIVGPQGWRAFTGMWTFQKEINWEIAGMYPGQIRYGPSLAALAVWGEKGPMPEKPAQPFAVRNPSGKVAPAADYKPEPGVPVAKFTNDKMPADWLALAGVNADAVKDPAKARPSVGEFKLLSHTGDAHYYEGQISITTAAERKYHTTAFFYTVVDNDAPRWARVGIGHGAVALYVNGERLREGEVVWLEKGLYPVMAVSPVAETSPWGREMCRPRFTQLTEAEAQAQVAAVMREHEEAVRGWEFAVDQHKRLGGANVEGLRLCELTVRTMRQYFREAMGAGGYMGAHLCSLEGPNRYAVAYRNVFGVNLSSGSDATHFLPRKVFTMAYGANGPGVGVEMDGTAGFVTRGGYVEGMYDLAANHFAMMYPLVPNDWKPSVLWAWQRQVGFTGPADAENALKEPGRPTTGYPYEAHTAWTFVNLPLDVKPVAPAGKLPLTWRADDYGWYGFRNGYKDENDFIAQVWLKRSLTGQNAGGFRVMGLGQQWAIGSPRMRMYENVVQLPEDTINMGGAGQLLYCASQPDGSGVVTMDLGDVYAAPSPNLYERQGFIRLPANLKPSGITGLRSVAVDYSGKSGAPCLLVIADKVSGAKQTLWSWPTQYGDERLGYMDVPEAKALITAGKADKAYTFEELKKISDIVRQANAAKLAQAKPADTKPAEINAEELAAAGQDVPATVDGNTFTIAKGAAKLRGTMVVPGNVKLTVEEMEQLAMNTKHLFLSRNGTTGVIARGQGEYLVVVTIGTGEPPSVKVTGQGLNSVVTVGSRKIRFDGTKVVLE